MHEMVSAHAEDPSEVVVGIELDRGLLVGALVAAGYSVRAINPLSVDRYRDRHRTSGAKSDPGDARVLADLVRTDRHLHREVAGDSELAEAVKVLARAHQGLIWSRQRQLNPAAERSSGVLPGGAGGLRDRSGLYGRAGDPRSGTHAGGGPIAEHLAHRRRPETRRTSPAHHRTGRGDQAGPPELPARGAVAARSSLRRRRVLHGSDRGRDDRSDRSSRPRARGEF